MAAAKSVLINGVLMGRGTSIKIDKNLNVSEENTFDGPVLSGESKVSYSIEIGKLIAPDLESYLELRSVLNEMETIKKPITIQEVVKDKSGNTYTVKQLFLNCLVNSYGQEISVDTLTTETIKFSAEDKEETATRN